MATKEQLRKLAEKWLEDFQAGKVSLPGVDRIGDPELSASDSYYGTSQFNGWFGMIPNTGRPERLRLHKRE